jgi:hypothetical protein
MLLAVVKCVHFFCNSRILDCLGSFEIIKFEMKCMLVLRLFELLHTLPLLQHLLQTMYSRARSRVDDGHAHRGSYHQFLIRNLTSLETQKTPPDADHRKSPQVH